MGEGAQSQASSLPTHKSVDELRQLLFERHDMAVDREDPVLLLYTIMRVCLDEQSEFKDTFLNMIAEAFEDGSNKFSEHLSQHHTVLSVASWVVYTSLLAGHTKFGWRGVTTTRWSLVAFVLLALAYFGTKFVIEFLLHRG